MNNTRIPISEIFFSISGEGTKVGTPTVFVRCAGCNFAEKKENGGFESPCKFCDTPYAWYKSQGTEMTIKQILQEVTKYKIKEVILTGGEPLWAPGITTLIANLNNLSYNVEIETNGSLPIWTKFFGRWSIDIKTPCSNNTEYNLYSNLKLLRKKDQVKFICETREDFEFAKMVLVKYSTRAVIIFQPSWGKLDPKELIGWVKEFAPKTNLSLRVGLQQHKYIFGEKRGV